MPVVSIHLMEGYEEAARARLGRAVGDAVRAVIPAPPEAVTVMIHELPAANYLRGGTARAPAAARPDPEQTVRAFLLAMEARDLDAARALTAPGFEMTFPGDVRLATLDALVDWAAPRYRSVTKRIERVETLPGPEAAVVYCFGTLHGVWPDGRSFEGVRFIDRFEVGAEGIMRQQVWNDLAEARG